MNIVEVHMERAQARRDTMKFNVTRITVTIPSLLDSSYVEFNLNHKITVYVVVTIILVNVNQ